MKNYKLMFIFSLVGSAILALAYLYNLIFALASDISPVIPSETFIFILPLMIGMVLVPYALKTENKILIYIGQMISVGSAAILVFQLGRLVFDMVNGVPSIVFLLTLVWPLLLLGASLTIMAFVKKSDFRPFHNVITLVVLAGIALSVLIDLVILIVWGVQYGAFTFGCLVPTFLIFVALAVVGLSAIVLKDEARLVKLEVPEWKKPIKPAPSPKASVEPKADPKVEPKEESKVSEEAASTPEEKPQA
ncbi:MAG: hypothetical protein WC282_04185 [Bacilli bacterium]|jgi:hypothetical protein